MIEIFKQIKSDIEERKTWEERQGTAIAQQKRL
jgi:hypothetical protein